jgi:hypothetical protein
MPKMMARKVSNAVKDKLGSDNLLWLRYCQRCGGGSVVWANMVSVVMMMMAIDMVMMWDADFVLYGGRRWNYLRHACVLERARIDLGG